MEQGKYDSAMFYFYIAYKVDEGTENFPYTLNAIGTLYRLQKQYDDAIRIQQRAIDEATKLDDKNYLAISLVGLAESYKDKGDVQNSLNAFMRAEQAANETKANYTLRDIYKGLSELYAFRKDFSNAYKYMDLLLNIKDTLYNIEADKKLGTLQFTYDLEKKENQINLLTKDQELKEQ
jgi:tetratricopeptide (TPR) repeat protein